jgi:hypothetical protein
MGYCIKMIVKTWNILLIAITNMLREALIQPGPYVASSVAGSIIAYAMSVSNEWNVFGISIGVTVAFALASFEILSIKTMIKLWRVKTSAFYAALVVSVFALIIEWTILFLADHSLPNMLRIVGIAFCIIPGTMYLLQSLNEWVDEQIDSTRQREQVDAELNIERKKKEQVILLQQMEEQAKWEVEQQRIKLKNAQEKSLAKINVGYVEATSKGTKATSKKTYICPYCNVDQGMPQRYSIHMRYCKERNNG